MARTQPTRTACSLLALVLAPLAALAQGCGGASSSPQMQPGQTDFTTTSPGQGPARGALPPSATQNGASPGGVADTTAAPMSPGAPMGRVADVQEADIYRIDKNRLFYLNTYRGFLAYDVEDAKNPKLLGRLPVYGYPVEMFVKGTTVYALLRDVLYLTQDGGKLAFQRRDVSQLVTIDVSNPGAPKVLSTIDIVGELREGVSRKIDDTIYVVSSIPQSYYYGWQQPGLTPPKEQAWVYSFNVADATNPALVQKLQIFEGGGVNFYDDKSSYYRSFSDVQIAATSNALMVVENWYVSASTTSGQAYCGGSYESGQLAIVSIVDVSDPSGAIRLHTKFQTQGHLSDQFKQTYVFDPATKQGTYYGIFARHAWASTGCVGAQHVQNSLESWDVTDGAKPARLARLDFGTDAETVRGTTFDVDRKVAFAITARQIDPLYALSYADRANLKVLSQIDGLSGSMSVFRTIEKNQYLMGIGTDTSATCSGSQNAQGGVGTNIAVSVIDVRDLAAIKLVQRGCVAVQNAEWVSSQLTWNMDQAHKMIGMFSDATANVVTVPVSYYQRSDDKDWWWYQWKTAVGIMSWDLTAYDPTKAPAAQTVLKNFGTFIHPNGEVQRSILFTHDGTATGSGPERMMINLSDTHMSIASLQDLNAPKLLANVEIAPYETALFRFGDYVVEEIQSQPYYGWQPNQDRTEFRVKAAGGDLDLKDPIATFSMGQVMRVFKQGENRLVAIRYVQSPVTTDPTQWTPPTVEAQVYDLTDPTKPRAAGKATLPSDVQVYYGYWCGGWYWGPWSFYGTNNNIVSTTSGLVIIGQNWSSTTNAYTTRLVSLDLTNADAPTVATTTVATATPQDSWWSTYGLVADPVDPAGFYLTYRTYVGDTKNGDFVLSVFKDYAQRWDLADGAWKGGASINLPGQLTRTYADGAGARMFVAQDYKWFWVSDATATTPDAGHSASTLRLSLLREGVFAGHTVASLLDSKSFDDTSPSSMVMDGQTLLLVAHKQPAYGYYYPGGGVPVSGPVAPGGGVGVARSALTGAPPAAEDDSDRLIAYDLAGGKFASLYDAPTGMYNSDLIGVHDGRLLVNLQGDGFLVVDVSDATAPRGVRFVRTLGWANNIEFAGQDVYVSSGFFGVQHFGVGEAPSLAPTN